MIVIKIIVVAYVVSWIIMGLACRAIRESVHAFIKDVVGDPTQIAWGWVAYIVLAPLLLLLLITIYVKLGLKEFLTS